MLFVAAGVGSVLQASGLPPTTRLEVAALAHGIAIAAIVSASAHVSGGVVNPAITLALAVTRRITARTAAVFVVAQLSGAVIGAAAVARVYGLLGPLHDRQLPSVAAPVHPAAAMLVEAGATAMLTWVVFAVAVDRSGAWFKVAALPIGAAVTVAMLMVGPVSGGVMNPARSLGPQLASGDLTNWWVWVIGPIFGAVVAGAAYMLVVRPVGSDALAGR